MKICSIDGCASQANARGYCSKHYKRWQLHGDPHIVLAPKSDRGAAGEFLGSLPLEGEGCVIWPFARTSAGYGHINLNGRNILASRIACERKNGPPPTPDHMAAHLCGKGHEGCVAPWHLSWKTATENAADMVVHGTRRRGSELAWSRLTEDQIAEIRRSVGPETQAQIGRRFGIGQSHVSQIVRRKVWGHVA